MNFYSSDSDIQTTNPSQIIEELLRRTEQEPNQNQGQISNDQASYDRYLVQPQQQFSLNVSDDEQELPVTLPEPQIEFLAQADSMETTLTWEPMDSASESHRSYQMEEEEIDQILEIDSQQPYRKINNPYTGQFLVLNRRLISVESLNPRKKAKDQSFNGCQCHQRCRETRSCNCTRRGVPCGSDCYCKCTDKECSKKRKRISSQELNFSIEGFPLEWSFLPFCYPEP